MMERKLYKTKLCVLYQRGHCSRQSCSFAHGDAELRRVPGSMNGRREYRGADLRDKLERRDSPYRRYSPGRDARGRGAFRNRKQVSRDRGYITSRSPAKRSERRHDKRPKLDGQSDASGSSRTSDDDEDRHKGEKNSHDDETNLIREKLKEAQMDVDMLEENKSELETILKEKVQESDNLLSKIEELESQLNNERDDCRRFISKNKKFTKALGRYLRAQEELKRSQSRLQKLADQLDSDNMKSGANEEDSSINIPSDGDLNHFGGRHEPHAHASPRKKRARLSIGTSEETKSKSGKNLDKFLDLSTRAERLVQSETSNKETDTVNKVFVRNDFHRLRADDHKQKIRSSFLGNTSDKMKGPEVGTALPATSMAAHAVDELLEAIEVDEKSMALETTVAPNNGSVKVKAGLPYPPPPPPKIAPNAYKQYEGDDEEVDVEQVDAEVADVDVTSEVDIEKD